MQMKAKLRHMLLIICTLPTVAIENEQLQTTRQLDPNVAMCTHLVEDTVQQGLKLFSPSLVLALFPALAHVPSPFPVPSPSPFPVPFQHLQLQKLPGA